MQVEEVGYVSHVNGDDMLEKSSIKEVGPDEMIRLIEASTLCEYDMGLAMILILSEKESSRQSIVVNTADGKNIHICLP